MLCVNYISIKLGEKNELSEKEKKMHLGDEKAGKVHRSFQWFQTKPCHNGKPKCKYIIPGTSMKCCSNSPKSILHRPAGVEPFSNRIWATGPAIEQQYYKNPTNYFLNICLLS